MENSSNNPMQSSLPMHRSPRCGARTRAGSLCRSPAIAGRVRCRMHGAPGSGAPAGNRNAWKHGERSSEVLAMRAMERLLLRMAREALEAE